MRSKALSAYFTFLQIASTYEHLSSIYEHLQLHKKYEFSFLFVFAMIPSYARRKWGMLVKCSRVAKMQSVDQGLFNALFAMFFRPMVAENEQFKIP